MNISVVIVSSLLGVLTAACASPAEGSPPSRSQPTPPAAMAGPLERAVNAARADAARRTGVAAESRALISAEGVTWSDGSLGCPQPGMMYTQALVPGYRVRLRGPNCEMVYHTSTSGALVLCPAGRAVDPLPGASPI